YQNVSGITPPRASDLPGYRSFRGELSSDNYLVTFLYPTRLASEARWRAGVRLTLGPLRPLLSLAPRPPFHRTRTVAGAAPRARLDKDGSPWRRSPLASMYRRTASTWPCVQVLKILPCRALVPGSTTSWRVSRF